MLAMASIAILLVCSSDALAVQGDGVVVVDESPTAGLRIDQILDQVSENPDQSARICVQVLDDFGPRLVISELLDPDLFTTARSRVEGILLDHPQLLSRFTTLQEPVARGLLQEGLLQEVVDRAWLTLTGVHASLMLAQDEMEAGDIHAARSRLQRLAIHPLINSDQEGYRQMMLGMIGALLGDETAVGSARSQLDLRSEYAQKLERLDLVNRSLTELQPESFDTFDGASLPPMTADPWHQVWSHSLDGSPLSELLANSIDASSVRLRSLETLRSNGRAMTAIPLAGQDLVFVNDGGQIQAFDRYGAGRRWVFELGPSQINIGDYYVDPGEMALSGDSLVALTGVGLNSGRTSTSEIICLDPADGHLNWRRDINSVGDSLSVNSNQPEVDFSRAFPFGSLVIEAGKVIFPVRKVNSRRETMLYLVGLDLKDGSVSWIRFLGSSGGLRTNRGFSRILSDRGSIIVASPVGVIARVNPVNGDPDWVRRFQVPIARVLAPGNPWQISQPAVHEDAIYALAPNRRQLVQIDWSDGSLEREWTLGSGSRFGDPRYLVMGDNSNGEPILFAVGNDIHGLKVSPDLPLLWTFSQMARDEIVNRSGSNVANGIRGRVHATSGTLVVPGYGDAFIVDSNSGRVIKVIPTPDASNPLMLDSQLLLAGNDSIVSLMQLNQAEKMLRLRISADPDDPSRALGLLELAIKANLLDVAFESARIVLSGINRSSEPDQWATLREQVITILLDLSNRLVTDNPDSAAESLEIAASLAITPLQRAMVKLELADLLFRDQRQEEGVALLAQTLGDPEMSSVMVPTESGVMQVRLRIPNLIASDPSAQIIWEQLSKSELATVDQSDVTDLVSFSRSHVGTYSAVTALLTAVEISRRSGLVRDSLNQLFEAIRMRNLRTSTLVDACDYLESLGLPAVAREVVLDFEQRPGFDQSLPNDDFSRLSRILQSVQSKYRLPAIGTTMGSASLQTGQMIANACAQGDFVFMGADRIFKLYSPAVSDPIWELPLDVSSVDYVWAPRSHNSLQLVSTDGQSLFTTVDLESGAILGRSGSLAEFFPNRQIVTDDRRGLIPGGGVFRPESFIIEPVGEDSLMIVRRNGDMVFSTIDAIGDDTAPVIRWKKNSILDRIYEVNQFAGTLVVSGVSREIDAQGVLSEIPNVLLFDLVTGDQVAEFTPSFGESPRWVKISPSGLLLIGYRSGVEARILHESAEPIWMNTDVRFRGTSREKTLVFGNRLISAQSSSTVAALNLTDGIVLQGKFEYPDLNPEDEPTTCLSISSDSNGITVLMDNHVARWDTQGELCGLDAITGSPALIALFETNDSILVLEERIRRNRQALRTYWIHRLDPAQGLMISGSPIEFQSSGRPVSMVVICPDWILVQVGTNVLGIPMPCRRESGEPG
ncbi:MAG: hypothetical protein CBC35_01355 [Planctomycetes bacterium TMED75]|nr:hypothetical protein [Planctomycetaceae bacterium]OUU96449.1 MAG: hypothetical protein CBC35_01355 [Planctomycetes bacterium TMED75]